MIATLPTIEYVPLEVEEDALPGPDPLPARAAEKATRQCHNREEDREDREHGNRELAIFERAARVAVHIRQECQPDQHEARKQHTGNRWREVVQNLLQTEE